VTATSWAEVALVLILITNLRLLGGSRLGAIIQIVALQGVLLGTLPVFQHLGALTPRLVGIAAGAALVKGLVFPLLLRRALVKVGVRREVEPLVGYGTSLLIGALLLGAAAWIGGSLPLPRPTTSPMLVPVALFTLFTGLFLVVSRKKAITQVLGYLVFENGVYAFGVAVAAEQPLMVEMGVLLDVFVAVFVMGIIVFHIQREFDHIDVDRMTALRDVAASVRAPAVAPPSVREKET
jgi:hydrogenase-4 component E